MTLTAFWAACPSPTTPYRAANAPTTTADVLPWIPSGRPSWSPTMGNCASAEDGSPAGARDAPAGRTRARTTRSARSGRWPRTRSRSVPRRGTHPGRRRTCRRPRSGCRGNGAALIGVDAVSQPRHRATLRRRRTAIIVVHRSRGRHAWLMREERLPDDYAFSPCLRADPIVMLRDRPGPSGPLLTGALHRHVRTSPTGPSSVCRRCAGELDSRPPRASGARVCRDDRDGAEGHRRCARSCSWTRPTSGLRCWS